MKLTSEQYAIALFNALKSGAHREDVCREFAQMLYEHGATGRLKEVERAYEALRREREHELVISVSSGQPIGEHIFSGELNERKVREEYDLDPALIGGVRLRINDTLVDTTISKRLKDLTNALT